MQSHLIDYEDNSTKRVPVPDSPILSFSSDSTILWLSQLLKSFSSPTISLPVFLSTASQAKPMPELAPGPIPIPVLAPMLAFASTPMPKPLSVPIQALIPALLPASVSATVPVLMPTSTPIPASILAPVPALVPAPVSVLAPTPAPASVPALITLAPVSEFYLEILPPLEVEYFL